MEKGGKAYSIQQLHLKRAHCSGTWTESPVRSNAHGQSQASGPIWPEGSVGTSGIWVSGERATTLPAHPGRKASSQPTPTAKHSLMSCSCRKPGQTTQIAKKPVLRPCLGKELSQTPCPTVEHSPWHHITRKPDQGLWTTLELNPWYHQAEAQPVTPPDKEPSQ